MLELMVGGSLLPDSRHASTFSLCSGKEKDLHCM